MRLSRRQKVAAAAEAYRIMRTNLLVAISDIDRPTVMITSAMPGEGKTSTVANLAPALALAGQRIVVVDLDLRHPDLHNAFGLPNDHGVADVLRGDADLADCMTYVGVEGDRGEAATGMYVLTSGPTMSDGSELISGRRCARMLSALADQSDLVLIDSAPVLPVADTLSLARMVAGVVLVVEARRTPLPAIQQAKDSLIRNQARLLGVVVNKLQATDTGTASPGGQVASYAYP